MTEDHRRLGDAGEPSVFLKAKARHLARRTAAVGALCIIAFTQSASHAAEVSCTPPGANLTDPTPAHFSIAQLDQMRRSYAAQEVRGLRAALDADLAGDVKPRTSKLLKSVLPGMLRNRFILLSDDKGAFGGSFLTVAFKGYPKAVYRAWVYSLSGGPYELRSWEAGRCSDVQQHWLKSRYSSLYSMVGG